MVSIPAAAGEFQLFGTWHLLLGGGLCLTSGQDQCEKVFLLIFLSVLRYQGELLCRFVRLRNGEKTPDKPCKMRLPDYIIY